MFPVSKREYNVNLKPQDTLLALKYWSLKRGGGKQSVRDLAEAIGISASEVSKGSKRLLASRLAVERAGEVFVESGALLEWLCYGVRYAYPLESVGYGRGMATSWNCPVLVSEVSQPVPPLVWQVSGGETEGVLIKPFHDAVPLAARRDAVLYRALALLDAIRGGKPRELAIARQLLQRLIKASSD